MSLRRQLGGSEILFQMELFPLYIGDFMDITTNTSGITMYTHTLTTTGGLLLLGGANQYLVSSTLLSSGLAQMVDFISILMGTHGM